MGSVLAVFRKRRQDEFHHQHDIKDLQPAGSYVGAVLATIAASALIISAGCQNISFAWSLGMASSEFKAVVLAIASAGATLLAPLAFASITSAFRKRRYGAAIVALALGTGALTYSAVSSLGFVHGSRDSGITERVAAADAYADKKALAKAAREELAGLKGQKPEIVERRSELTALLADLSKTLPDGKALARPETRDPQASAVGFYMRAAGWTVDDADVGLWLSFGMVMFMEAAAALSLIVAGALTPSP